MKTIGAKMFTGYQASKFFSELYEGLNEDRKEKFGAAIRAEFDRKITGEDAVSFYLSERDVAAIYDSIMK